GGVHGEVGGCHVAEVVPAHRERDGHTGPHAGTVGGHHRRPADARCVDKDLAATVLFHEGGGGQRGVEPLGAHCDGSGGGGRILGRRLADDRDENVHALGSARLDCTFQAD